MMVGINVLLHHVLFPRKMMLQTYNLLHAMLRNDPDCDFYYRYYCELEVIHFRESGSFLSWAISTGTKMTDPDQKIIAEHAKSGKYSCKKCFEKIKSNLLRLGFGSWDP